MFNAKLIAFLLSLRAVLLQCCPPQERDLMQHQVSRYARMERLLVESSGLEHAGDGTFWTMRDSGGASTLYRIASDGSLLDSLPLALPNKDWEALARDKQGNLYIGDVGNNLNRRKDLRIYKLHPASGTVDTIAFHWMDQERFPPGKKEQNFDCEAMFWYQNQLHLFTKSRGDKQVRHYVLPDQPGDYPAALLESVYIKDLVTAADISPDGLSIALLTYGKIYLFAVQGTNAMLQQPITCLRIPWAGQSESVLFINNNSLVLGNETGRLFYVQLHPQ